MLIAVRIKVVRAVGELAWVQLSHCCGAYRDDFVQRLIISCVLDDDVFGTV